ncbi:MFS transporter [Pasteuria penetrans]|uniref:MFS transporter n=1 Tax=Pasteuria penetrans TaxID=86005 RepID=UPI000F95BC9D|nr:MFS transporter [Pasteuria penetrans]
MRATKILDQRAWLLLIISGLFALVNTLSGMFTNIYLWKINPSYTIITLFNLTYCVVSTLSFVTAGWFCKRFDRIATLRFGAVFLALFHIIILMVGNQAIHYIYFLGVLLGLGSGYFWIAYNVLYFEITGPKNRDCYNGLQGFTASLAGMIGPLVAGWIIDFMPSFLGYRVIFISSFCLLLIIVVITLAIRRVPTPGRFSLLPLMVTLTHPSTRDWCRICCAKVLYGFREGVLVYVISVFAYSVFHDELELGCFFTLGSFLSMVAFALVSRILTPTNRNLGFFVGTLGMFLAVLPLLRQLDSFHLLLFGVLLSIFYPFYVAPLISAVFDMMEMRVSVQALRVEHVVMRELSIGIGRILGMLFFLYWVADGAKGDVGIDRARWFIICMSFVQLGVWWIMRPLLRRVTTPQQRIPSFPFHRNALLGVEASEETTWDDSSPPRSQDEGKPYRERGKGREKEQ